MNKLRPPSKRRYILRHVAIALASFALLAVVAGVFLFPSLIDDPVAGPPIHATPVDLIRIVDGDTIVVRTGDGRQERVRYIGMDAPEYDAGSGAAQQFGREAFDYNAAALEGRPLRLALDREHRDRYDRLLAYVYAGDQFVNGALVREGLARVLLIPPNDKHGDLLLALQAEALAAGRGLWGAARNNPIPWEDAAAHVGRAAAVEGVVVRTHKDPDSGITFLNFSSRIRQDFVVLVSEPYGRRFPKPPESNYSGRRVRVLGLVETYEGQPQIEVQIPEQIEVLD